MNDCIFCDIAAGKKGELIWQNDIAAAFYDINPKAPIHALVVPKQHIKNLEELDNPDLEFERKKEIMKKIGRYEARLGSELAHVQSLGNLVGESGLFINPRDLKRIGLVLKKERIFIVKVPSYSNGRIQGYYNYVANGDVEKITNIVQNSGELAD